VVSRKRQPSIIPSDGSIVKRDCAERSALPALAPHRGIVAENGENRLAEPPCSTSKLMEPTASDASRCSEHLSISPVISRRVLKVSQMTSQYNPQRHNSVR
jgi:hypothetical protein